MNERYRYELTIRVGYGIIARYSKYKFRLTLEDAGKVLSEVSKKRLFTVNGSVFKSDDFDKLVNLDTTAKVENVNDKSEADKVARELLNR